MFIQLGLCGRISSCILLLSQIRINFTHCVLLYFFIPSIISLILGYLYIYLRYAPAYTIRDICYSRSYPSANDKIFSFVPKCTQLISWYFDQGVADQRSLFVVFFVRLCKDKSHTISYLPRNQESERPPSFGSNRTTWQCRRRTDSALRIPI